MVSRYSGCSSYSVALSRYTATLSLPGVHLVFDVFQDAWRSDKENPSAYWNATLPCPFMASNYSYSFVQFFLILGPFFGRGRGG